MAFWIFNNFKQPCNPSTGQTYNWHFDSNNIPCWNTNNAPCGFKFNASGQICDLNGKVCNWQLDNQGNVCDGNWKPVYTCPPKLDGIVEGTGGNDLIDYNYTGDPDGDKIDHNDATLPGEAPQDDIVYGYGGDDRIYAGLGNDDVYGGIGNDTVAGGDGDDILRGETGNDVLDGDNGNDVISGGDQNDAATGGAGNDTLNGDLGDDTLSGDAGNDLLFGGDGNDQMFGGDHNDLLDGGNGTDIMAGGLGDDTLAGGQGSDTIHGDTGNDVIYGGGGVGASGNLIQNGSFEDVTGLTRTGYGYVGTGSVPAWTSVNAKGQIDIHNDHRGGLNPTDGANWLDLEASPGNIRLGQTVAGVTAGQPYVLEFDAGDIVGGANGANVYWGGQLVGFINPTDGVMSHYTFNLTGGAGNGTNRLEFEGTGNGTDNLGVSIDKVNLYSTVAAPDAAGDLLYGDGGADLIYGLGGNDTMDGGTENDTLLGGDGNDTVAGGDGNDVVAGDKGDDVLTGGTGADTLTGGDDRDMFVGGTAGDAVDGSEGGSDSDTLDLRGLGRLNIAYDPLNAENGTVTFIDVNGAPTGSMTFKNIENVLKDPQRDGIVDGTAGNDVIDAAYTGDPQGDRIDNSDAILPGQAPQDDIVKAYGGDDLVKSGLGNDDVYGGTGNDTVFGGDGNDLLRGEDGNDVLNGDLGNDTLDGAAGNDSLNGGLGDDSILGGDGSDTADGGDGNDVIDTSGKNPLNDYFVFPSIPVDAAPNDDRDLVYGGLGNDKITTGDDADTIYGGDGADTIDAGIDADLVFGGLGNDSIDGGLGADTVDGGDGDDYINAGIDAYSDYANEPFGLFGGIQDPNKNDGRDLVYGGTGNDTILTGDDADTIYGGIGNDTIWAGIDDDYVEGGDGNDVINAGHGSDTVYGGLGNDVINGGTGYPQLDIPDATDPNPNNGIDLLFGGDGNDIIYGEDDDDTLFGDAGNDTLYGGIDEDTLYGGTGDDKLFGGNGPDVLFGGQGNDVLSGDGDNDTMYGEDGNDTLLGGVDEDTLYGGTGNDLLEGNKGDDLFVADTGTDTMLGGNDQDTFTGFLIGDSIDGGEGGVDFDTLDLRGTGPKNIIYSPTNPENGVVNWLDTLGNVIGTTTFENIENVIPCFTPGTSIATPRGECLVEDLKVGDKIITRDNGLQEIRWVGAKAMDYKALAANPHLKPVLIQKGALGNSLPERDMLVSPNHRMLVANDRTSLYFEEHEVLVAAKHLINHRGVHEIDSMGTTYIHFMFDQHQVVLSNGAWTESFQPGDYTLKGMGNAQRNEIFDLFPELKTTEGLESYTAARKTLKRHEAALLKR